MGRIVFVDIKRKGKQIQMGIADRDYMRDKDAKTDPPRARAFVRKADNRPSLLKRLRFWFWNLRHKE
jgi:hypothetical protein